MLALFLASCSYENSSSSLRPLPHHKVSLASPLLSPRTFQVKILPERLPSKYQPITTNPPNPAHTASVKITDSSLSGFTR
ncbi:hypothetical protein L873DRAFT_1805388 [Choiromyces venosus 120613-1]|uniref:Uncharacterized protein n=1 Tax=Choiromyces venosus 120613-1 TaxID=1336337 RepID=A0A3N4K2Y5_9PEZI|nr:hypothetical protein L873DRAFT_1805388 [Choiromyces venosus 120613-1]